MLTAEAEYVLRTIEERNIRFVRLWFTDVLGFLKAFTITSQELEGALRDGMGFDGSSIEGSAASRIRHDRGARPLDVPHHPWQTEHSRTDVLRHPRARRLPVRRDARGVEAPAAPPIRLHVLRRAQAEHFYFTSLRIPVPGPGRLLRRDAAGRNRYRATVQ
jgi:hypothetical protein